MSTLKAKTLVAAQWYRGGGDIVLFVALSLAFSMFLGQDQVVSRGDLTYWLLIAPAVIFPLLRVRQTVASLLFGLARPMAILAICSGLWFIIRGEYAVVLPLILLAWISGWVLRTEAKVSVNLLLVAFLLFYATGVVRFYTQPPISEVAWLNGEFAGEPEEFTGLEPFNPEAGPSTAEPDQKREGLTLNAWGVLPGQTASTYGPWRISATPNIATSGTMALFAMIFALSSMASMPLRLLSMVVSGYFLFLSFVRSALVGFFLFGLAQVNLRVFPGKGVTRSVLAALLVGGAIAVTAVAPYALYVLQDVGVVSRLFLRGQTHMSVSDIYRQMYRPWLWGQHLQLFLSSDFWMGQGNNLAADAARSLLNAGQARSDSVSLPTRLLATYGLPSLAFFWFIVERCYRHIKANDIWAMSAASAIIWLMLTWGSIFHPTNAIFVLSILILGRGSDAFKSDTGPDGTGTSL